MEDGGGEEEKEGEGDKRKVSCFCLQLKEFFSNFSLETGTLLKNLYFHLLAQGKLSHSFLSHGSSLYVFQEKKKNVQQFTASFIQGGKTTKYMAAILPSVSFQENRQMVSLGWLGSANYWDKCLLNLIVKVYFSLTQNLSMADSFLCSGSEAKVLLCGGPSIS